MQLHSQQKLPILKLKTRPKQLLGSLCNWDKCSSGRNHWHFVYKNAPKIANVKSTVTGHLAETWAKESLLKRKARYSWTPCT